MKIAHVMTPNKLILIDGFRLDHIYTKANASEEDRKGRVSSGAIA